MNIGEYNTLTIARQTPNGLYLEDQEQNEVLLPNRYIPEEVSEGWAIGDSQRVFVYMDSDDRVVATTETPYLTVGEVAKLEVVAAGRIGAFVDWGLPKDLLVPHANQIRPLSKGESVLVYAYLDNTTGRIVGSAKLNRHINNEEITVAVGEEVDIVVAQRRDMGYRVVINNKHWGMIYFSEIFSDIFPGQKLKAWVRKITEDMRIDLSLQQRGFDQVKVASDALLQLLEENDGEISVGDKSDAAEIQMLCGVSKKVFKRAVGYLLAAGKVEPSAFTTKLKG